MKMAATFIRSRARARQGQMMVVFGLTLAVFIGAMMLGIDLTRLRAESENAQRAANAAALAGVVFLPNFPSNAYARAVAEAKKNGFVSTGTNGITVDTQRPNGYNTRLNVTISEPVSLIFGGVFGLSQKSISRSATAEFAEPVQMGAPDYVLGYAPYPTAMVSSTGNTQGFYLIARGPYGQQENGDAYSQYFESYSSGGLNPSGANSSNYTDPCTGSAASVCTGVTAGTALKPNPDRAAIGFDGYNFVVDNPFTNTLVLKLFDPYDEGPFNAAAASANKPSSSSNLPAGYSSGGLPDQYSCSAGNTHFCDSPAPYPVALHFTLDGPYQTTYDTTPKPVPVAPTGGFATTSCPSGADCVLSNYTVAGRATFVAGDDPTYEKCQADGSCGASTTKSPYAYRFVNYAIIRHPGIYRIHVKTDMNIYGIYSGKYGNGGNVFGLAACYADPATSPAVLSTDPNHPAGPGNAAVSDPTNGNTVTWWQPSCPSPNNTSLPGVPSGCSTPGTAPSGTCVHIYAENRMCIYANLNAGKGLVPLGYVPPEYDGKTLRVRLYDVGDISSNANIEVLTPAGDSTHFDSTTVSNYPTSLSYTYSASPTDAGSPPTGSGYTVQPESPLLTPSEINVTDASGNHPFNGSWLTIDVPIKMPSSPPGLTYRGMVNTFGGYWKMLYDIGGQATDTTTWEVTVAGSPVHLISS